MLSIKRIRKFTFLYTAFIIFVLKLNLNDFLKPVIDYYKLNDIIIPVRYLLLFISEIQNRFKKVK